MLSSIRLRLILSHLTVIVIATTLAAFVLLSSLQRYFVQTLEDSLLAQARITAQALIPGSATAGPAPVQQASLANTLQQRSSGGLALQAQNVGVPNTSLSSERFDLNYLTDASLQLSSQLDTRIRILDSQGTVLVDSAGGRGTTLGSDPLMARALQANYASGIRQAAGDRFPAMHVMLPVLRDRQMVGVIYLSQSLGDMTAVLSDVQGRLLLSAVIALLLSGVAGLFLAQAIARPIRQLTLAAEAVAHGHLDQQVPAPGRDELGRLSRTFNEMTARLRTARQMQVDFVADVSHELRTPLTSLKALVESLRDGAVDDLGVRDRFLQTMEGETDRLIRLVTDLLTLSRADSQALNLQRQAVDVYELIGRAVTCIEPNARARQVAFDTQSPDPAGPGAGTLLAWADPDRIGQVLSNILSNAVQYSHPGGTVAIGAERSGAARLVVTVRDHGIGIAADALPRIGQRFYRADKARSRVAGGSGLGLAIAQALVEAHGGELQIQSAEGAGTSVSFILPSA